MLAEEVKPGDLMMSNDEQVIVYRVEEVRVQPPHVVATVRFYADAGTGVRMWEIGKPVPLTAG